MIRFPSAHHRTGFRTGARRVLVTMCASSMLTIGVLSAPAHADTPTPVLDRYGQKTAVDWPGKVTEDQQLRADVTADQKYYTSLRPPVRDAWGGDAGTRGTHKLTKTGWFHVETKNGRSMLVDPSGDQFFSLGVNSFGSIGDTYTDVAGREDQFAWLPDRSDTGPLSAGWRTDDKQDYSFYVANVVRKYGVAWNEANWYARQVSRIKKWGFNTAGGFSNLVPGGPKIPYVAHLDDSPAYRIGGSGLPDIYHAGYATELDRNFARSIAAYKADRYLIGYMFFNELNWSAMRTAVTQADGSQVASKMVLIKQLEGTYGTIDKFNAAWQLDVPDWSALTSLSFAPTTDQAVGDVDTFTKTYLNHFYGLYADTIRRHDRQHMVIGDRWLAPVINDDKLRGELATAAGKHLDALTYNYYSWDLSTDRITDIYDKSGHKPMIITEFHYGEPTHGLTFAARMAANETDKGRLYRNYVEKAAASGMVIGTHWFEYLDEAGTGRWFQGYNGEAGAIGLIDVTDRPYRKMLTNVMEANYSVYNLMDRKRAPYEYPFTPAQSDRQSNNTTEIPHATSTPVIDGALDTSWPSGPTLSLGPQDLVLGTATDGVGADFRLAWDDQNLYLQASVKDPTPMLNPNHGFDIWNGDAVELFVGADNVDQGGGIQLTDSQVIISAQPQDSSGKAEYYWYNNKTTQPVIRAVTAPTDGGYQLEAAIPLAGLNIGSVTPPRRLRFDVGLDDGTGVERQRQYLWNGVDGDASNREKWGGATLVEQATSGSGATPPPADAQILTSSTVVDGQVIVAGTGKPGSRYRAWIDGQLLGTMTVYQDGRVRYPFDLPAGIRTGSHVVTVTYGSRLLDEATVRLRPRLQY